MNPQLRGDLADMFRALHIVAGVEGQRTDIVTMRCGEVDDAVLSLHYRPEVIVHADVAVFPEFRVELALHQVADGDLMVFYE